MSESKIEMLLQPFGIALNAEQIGQIRTYLDLLLHWNRRINLTSIRDPEQLVTRHFAESLFVTAHQEFTGSLLDIGSGAGFPGLALKIVLPDIPATLLEPLAKKRAFLKEVARCCHLDLVEVRPERLEHLSGEESHFKIATARAVGPPDRLARQSCRVLTQGGRLCIWTTQGHMQALGAASGAITWTDRVAVPLSHERVVLIGVRSY